MNQSNTIFAVSDYVDHLCAVEMRSSRLPQGTILKLYDEAQSDSRYAVDIPRGTASFPDHTLGR